ncbi:MAG: hypothetical protein VX764_04195 [Planctomycetota bacterium]|nr:hypothetical protein [Planctomycetota bacterium]
MGTCLRQVFVAAWTVLILALPAGAQQSFTIADANTQGFSSFQTTVSLNSDSGTQGYVLAIAVDGTLLEVTDVTVEGTDVESVGVELAVGEIVPGGFTFGVILDALSPYEGQEIPAGSGTTIANLSLSPIVISPSAFVTLLQFQDGVFNSPPLDNIIVQGGLSIGVAEGLLLNDGAVTVNPPPPDSLRVEDSGTLADGISIGEARVLISNSSGPIQGFVVAIAHGPDELTLQEITLEGTLTEEVGAEFEVSNLYADGGTIGVVLDFQPPFDGQVIETGFDNHVATYKYSCNQVIYLPDSDLVTPLTPINNFIGTPPLENVIVVGGLSLLPSLESGSFTCQAIEPPPEDNTVITAEVYFDHDSGNYAHHGQTGLLRFYYRDPDDELQGLTITVCYDCDLTVEEGTFSLEGSIVQSVGAEYINHQVDDDCSDGETGELIIAILLDALPPFEGQTLPPTEEDLLIGTINITVDDSAECNELQEINFCDNIDGNGSVFLYNNVVIDYRSVQDFERINTSIHVVPQEIFQRGDCNSDDKVDLADVATEIGFLFSGLPITCSDACDSNDDGIINLADSVFILNWLFKFGATPPDPGPLDNGPDPTSDLLPICNSHDTGCETQP